MEETKRCPYCGEEILAVAKKCKHCGEWLEKKKIHCPVCQEEIDEDATVCPHCHEKIQEESVQPSTTVESSTPEQESERRSARSLFTVYFWRPITCQYADFKGKTSRKAFWKFFWFYLGTIVIFIALSGIPVSLTRNTDIELGHRIEAFVWYINLLYFLITLIPCAAMVIRRLSDIDKKKYWWTYLIFLLTNPYTVLSIGFVTSPFDDDFVMDSYFPVALILSIVFGIWLLVLLRKPTQHNVPNPMKCSWRIADSIFVFVVVGLLAFAIFGDKVIDNKDRNEEVVSRYAYSFPTKTWVFAKCIDAGYWGALEEDYKTSIGYQKNPQNKFVERWQEVLDLCIFDLDTKDIDIDDEEELEKILQDRLEYTDYFGRLRTEERAEVEKIARQYLFGFQKFFMDVADNEVKVLDWDLDPSSQTNAYKGYLVTYEIGSGYYVLLHLLIHSDDSRYNMRIIYRGESLSKLTNHRSDYLTK